MRISLEDYNKEKGLMITQLNCAGLFNNRDQIYALLGRADVLGFSETWCTSDTTDTMVNWPHRVIFRNDRGTGKIRGGVGCSIKSKYAKYATVLEDLKISTDDIEGISIALKLPNDKPIIVTTVYRPHTKCKMKPFIDYLNKVISYDKNGLKSAEHWVIGDYNIHFNDDTEAEACLLYTSPSPRDKRQSRMPSSA